MKFIFLTYKYNICYKHQRTEINMLFIRKFIFLFLTLLNIENLYKINFNYCLHLLCVKIVILKDVLIIVIIKIYIY